MATETKDPQKKSNAITRFLGEFKEFISKGNVLDMAAGINFQDLGFHIPWGNHPYINIGAFLSAVITFLITAFCVFLIVKAVNTMRNLTFKKKEEEKKEEPEKVAPDIALLTEIRDLLKQQQSEETKR